MDEYGWTWLLIRFTMQNKMKPFMEATKTGARRRSWLTRLFDALFSRHTPPMTRFSGDEDRGVSVALADFIRDPATTMRRAEHAPIGVQDARGNVQMTISIPTDRRPLPE